MGAQKPKEEMVMGKRDTVKGKKYITEKENNTEAAIYRKIIWKYRKRKTSQGKKRGDRRNKDERKKH